MNIYRGFSVKEYSSLTVTANASLVLINNPHKKRLLFTGVSDQNRFLKFAKNTNIFEEDCSFWIPDLAFNKKLKKEEENRPDCYCH